MQKEISSLGFLNVQDNVLLKNANRLQYRTAQHTVLQAQQRAKKIIAEANLEADAVRQESYRIGYESGLVMAVEAMAAFFNNKNRLVNEVYQQLRDDVKSLLAHVINQESVIVTLFEDWAQSVEKKEDGAPFHILLPLTSRHYKQTLVMFIESMHQGGVVFEFHQDSRYVFKYREQLVEFSPEVFAESQADMLFANKPLYTECEKVSTAALYHLYAQLEKYFPLQEDSASIGDAYQGEHRDDND